MGAPAVDESRYLTPEEAEATVRPDWPGGPRTESSGH